MVFRFYHPIKLSAISLSIILKVGLCITIRKNNNEVWKTRTFPSITHINISEGRDRTKNATTG